MRDSPVERPSVSDGPSHGIVQESRSPGPVVYHKEVERELGVGEEDDAAWGEQGIGVVKTRGSGSRGQQSTETETRSRTLIAVRSGRLVAGEQCHLQISYRSHSNPSGLAPLASDRIEWQSGLTPKAVPAVMRVGLGWMGEACALAGGRA